MTLLSGPNIAGNEWKYIKDCLDTGWVSSVGAYVTAFEKSICDYTGAKYAIATSNGTTALHISLLLADVRSYDYVIVPNITFIASVNAIMYTGAEPILVDIDEKTWQLDTALLKKFLQEETEIRNGELYHKTKNRRIRAVMPVHVLGNMVNMDEIIQLSNEYNLVIIEDSTEALGSFYKESHSGTFGLFGTFSFNGNKIITTGGGGMIVTNNEDLAKKAKHLTTQAKANNFEYYHDQIGYNYRLVNILAAMGVAQMEQLPKFIQKKKEISNYYKSELSKVGDIQFQKTTQYAKPNEWLFTIRTQHQAQLLKALNDKQLQSRPFWVPMNQLPMFKQMIYVSNNNISGVIYKECLSIPCSTNITDQELESVVNTISSTIV